MTLAQIYVRLGKRSLAEFRGQEVRDYYRKRCEQDENDIEAHLRWSSAEVFLEHFNESVGILTEGLQRTKDERFRKALSATYVTWFGRTDPSNLARQLELLQLALAFGPDNPAALRCLQFFGDKKGPEAQEVKQILEDHLAQGRAPGTVHFILGTMAIHADDLQQAATHLEQAHRASPNAPAIANNLAWAYTVSDPPKLDRALEMANIALELEPRRAEFLDTRGQIFIKMGRYNEAVTDLEASLKSLKDTLHVHASLADAYENLGVPDLAAKHRRLAQEPSQEDQP
jgi:tetratricopeptide (TPR) repeat protein